MQIASFDSWLSCGIFCLRFPCAYEIFEALYLKQSIVKRFCQKLKSCWIFFEELTVTRYVWYWGSTPLCFFSETPFPATHSLLITRKYFQWFNYLQLSDLEQQKDKTYLSHPRFLSSKESWKNIFRRFFITAWKSCRKIQFLPSEFFQISNCHFRWFGPIHVC